MKYKCFSCGREADPDSMPFYGKEIWCSAKTKWSMLVACEAIEAPLPGMNNPRGDESFFYKAWKKIAGGVA